MQVVSVASQCDTLGVPPLLPSVRIGAGAPQNAPPNAPAGASLGAGVGVLVGAPGVCAPPSASRSYFHLGTHAFAPPCLISPSIHTHFTVYLSAAYC